MVFELLWFLCLQGTKIQNEQMSVTPDRAPVANNRIFTQSSLESLLSVLVGLENVGKGLLTGDSVAPKPHRAPHHCQVPPHHAW